MDDLDGMARQVHELCSHCQLSDIRIDLQKTKSVEATVNRILDGGFLEGTERDPSRKTHIILDSDDESSPPRSTAQRSTVQRQMPLSPNPLDDDNDSLPSLDALVTQITDQEKNIDTIELDDSPPRNLLDDKYDFLKEWEDDLEVSSSSSKRRKEWENDLELESQQSRNKPKKKLRTPVDSLNESDREQSSRNKSKKKQKATVDYLKEWLDSSDNDDDGQGETETAKEKRERLKQQKQEEREAKARQRKEKQDAKKAEQERAKEEKKAERERKKLFEQANRLRTDRHKLLSEMILDVHPDFAASTHGELLINAIESKKAEVRVTNTDRYTIGWRRKCTAAWDDEEASFVPHELRIIEEPKVLVFMDIPRLCEFIQSSTMDAEIDRIQECAGSHQILLMIEGLETYYKKKTLLKQRDFERAVLENLSQGTSSRKKGKTDLIIEAAKTGPTKDKMENRLAYLQMMKSVMLIPTADREDSVDWLIALTADIANAMYKHRNNKHLRHQGPSKSGVDAADTWSRMLQEIQLCTPPVARSITSSYPTAQSLFRAYERTPDVRDKEDLLADLEVERSVLASRDRTINKSMSKKVYTIFTCTNDEHYIA